MKRGGSPPTADQVEMARWTASLGAITAEALALRRGLSAASARAMLSAAQRRGLFERERPLMGHPALFTLTRAGLRAADARGIDVCRVSASGAHHLIVCAAAAAALERCYPNYRVTGERELRRDEREHGRPLASAQLRATEGPKLHLHRPDLVLWPADRPSSPPVAVEVELTLKAPRRLLEICRAWARCRTVAGVLYLAAPDVERALAQAVAQARAREQVHVLPLSALPECETAPRAENRPKHGLPSSSGEPNQRRPTCPIPTSTASCSSVV